MALWRITGEAKPVVPVLAAALNDPMLRHPFLPPSIPLVQTESVPGVPAINPVSTAADPSPPGKSLPAEVARVLGEMGPAAGAAADALRAALKDPEEEVRSAVAKALKTLADN